MDGLRVVSISDCNRPILDLYLSIDVSRASCKLLNKVLGYLYPLHFMYALFSSDLETKTIAMQPSFLVAVGYIVVAAAASYFFVLMEVKERKRARPISNLGSRVSFPLNLLLLFVRLRPLVLSLALAKVLLRAQRVGRRKSQLASDSR